MARNVVISRAGRGHTTLASQLVVVDVESVRAIGYVELHDGVIYSTGRPRRRFRCCRKLLVRQWMVEGFESATECLRTSGCDDWCNGLGIWPGD
jgi:hypothetical protein